MPSCHDWDYEHLECIWVQTKYIEILNVVPSQCPVLMYYVFEFLWLLAKHSCEVISNSRLQGADGASAPWRMKTQRASCENTQLLLAVHRHHRQRRTLCMLVCVMISISLPGVHFLHVRHRCGWVVVVSSLSLTLTSLISCQPPRLSQDHCLQAHNLLQFITK